MKNLLTFGLLLLGFAVLAQPGMPNNPTPIDALSGILLVGGAAIGFWNKNKKK